MKELKHTKGEWIIRQEQLRLTSEKDDTIASFCYGDFHKSTANIKLAAAAPDMIEALIDCQKALELAINSTPTGDLRNKLCDANIKAMVAIDKAVNQ